MGLDNKLEDYKVGRFWDATRKTILWNKSISGYSWKELWPEAKVGIVKIYKAAIAEGQV